MSVYFMAEQPRTNKQAPTTGGRKKGGSGRDKIGTISHLLHIYHFSALSVYVRQHLVLFFFNIKEFLIEQIA